MKNSKALLSIMLLILHKLKPQKVDGPSDLMQHSEVNKLMQTFDYKWNENHYSKDGTKNHISISQANGSLVITINPEFQDRKQISFFLMPSKTNSKYLINTHPSIYKYWTSFYMPRSFSRKVLKTFLNILCSLNIKRQDLIIDYPSSDEHIPKAFHCHFYTGAEGYQKFITLMWPEKTLEFEKLSMQNKYNAVLKNEASIMTVLQDKIKSCQTPKVINYQEDFLNTLRISSQTFKRPVCIIEDKDSLINFFNEFHEEIKTLPILKQYENQIHELSDDTLKALALENIDLSVSTSQSHGDFTPWNMYVSQENKLNIFDFELYSEQRPISFDIFVMLLFQNKNVDSESLNTVENHIDSFLSKFKNAPHSLHLNKGMSALIFLIERSIYDPDWTNRNKDLCDNMKIFAINCFKKHRS